MKYRLTVIGAATLAVAACNTLQGNASANDNDNGTLANQVSSSQLSRIEGEMAGLRAQVTRNEEMLRGVDGARFALDLEQLRNELTQMRGQLEEQQNEINELKRSQRNFYVEMDNRLRALEKGQGGVANVTTNTNTTVPATPTLPSQPLSANADEGDQQAYQAALQLVRSRKYQAANEAFVGFLRKYPQSNWAGHAQYWLAETYYVNRDYDVALDQFSAVIANYPNSNKVASALLKKGYIYYEKKDWANAKSTLKQVTTEFPSAGAAKFAQRRLEKIKSEGN